MKNKNNDFPFLSILIPVKNEQDYICDCLESVYNNSYPHDRYEILVIDGLSTDNTKTTISRFQQQHSNLSLLVNEHESVPWALNLGIAAAKGDLLMWLCGHAVYSENYIQKSMELLTQTNAASVGGLVIPKGCSFTGKIIAAAMKSTLGHGNAVYRTGSRPGWVDTVMCGCWRRSSVERVGGFDTRWVRNQDSKFNTRLRETAGGIYFDPEISCYHYVRESFSGLARQYFEYGYWRFRTMKAHPGSVKLRQVIAPAFVLVLVSLAFISVKVFFILLSIYLSVLFVISALSKHVHALRERVLLPAVFAIIHFSWGAGFLYSAVNVVIEYCRRFSLKAPATND